MAKFLGTLASQVKVFPVLLIVFAWVLAPGALFGLSVAGVAVCAVVGGLIGIIVVAVLALIFMRSTFPSRLPPSLTRNFGWMPPVLRVQDGTEETPTIASAEGTSGPADADMGSAKSWWQ